MLLRINLTDTKEEISNKIKKAKTDPHPLPSTLQELKDRPEAHNLLSIYSSLSDQTFRKSIKRVFWQRFFLFQA